MTADFQDNSGDNDESPLGIDVDKLCGPHEVQIPTRAEILGASETKSAFQKAWADHERDLNPLRDLSERMKSLGGFQREAQRFKQT